MYVREGKQSLLVNNKEFSKYFASVMENTKIQELVDKIGRSIFVKVAGSGIRSQFQAVFSVLSKFLLASSTELEASFIELLKRKSQHDSRRHERYKPGLSGRRKSPPYNKR